MDSVDDCYIQIHVFVYDDGIGEMIKRNKNEIHYEMAVLHVALRARLVVKCSSFQLIFIYLIIIIRRHFCSPSPYLYLSFSISRTRVKHSPRVLVVMVNENVYGQGGHCNKLWWNTRAPRRSIRWNEISNFCGNVYVVVTLWRRQRGEFELTAHAFITCHSSQRRTNKNSEPIILKMVDTTRWIGRNYKLDGCQLHPFSSEPIELECPCPIAYFRTE